MKKPQFREDGLTDHKCHKCGRVCRQTIHSIDGVKVDYYIIKWEGKDAPIAECVDCRPLPSERENQP